MNKFQFRDLLRAAGEFTNAQVNGFYTRYCNDQITLEQILATAKPKDPVGIKGNYVDYRYVKPEPVLFAASVAEPEKLPAEPLRKKSNRAEKIEALINILSTRECTAVELCDAVALCNSAMHRLIKQFKESGEIVTRKTGSQYYYSLKNEVAA